MPMTYNSLVAQILSYTNRTDASTIANVPNFIYNAEQKISGECKSIGFEVYVTGNFVVGTSVIAKPSRWRRSITFNFGTGNDLVVVNQLYLRKYEFLRNYWPNPNLTGLPKYYSDYGYDHLLIAPTPNFDYPFEFSYLQLPEPLTPQNQTNWLTNNAPDVLLYGCLLEAAEFLQNKDLIPEYEDKYAKGVARLNGQDSMRVRDRASNGEAD